MNQENHISGETDLYRWRRIFANDWFNKLKNICSFYIYEIFILSAFSLEQRECPFVLILSKY